MTDQAVRCQILAAQRPNGKRADGRRFLGASASINVCATGRESGPELFEITFALMSYDRWRTFLLSPSEAVALEATEAAPKAAPAATIPLKRRNRNCPVPQKREAAKRARRSFADTLACAREKANGG